MSNDDMGKYKNEVERELEQGIETYTVRFCREVTEFKDIKVKAKTPGDAMELAEEKLKIDDRLWKHNEGNMPGKPYIAGVYDRKWNQILEGTHYLLENSRCINELSTQKT